MINKNNYNNLKLGDAQEIFTANIAELIAHINQSGYSARLREVERTAYQQAQYVKVGASKTFESNHLKSLAADIYILQNEKLILEKTDLKNIGTFWESLHPLNRWGGNFKSFTDTPHFEMNFIQ